MFLVAETSLRSTFLEEEKDRAKETCHSTAKQAATLGKNAKVKNLVLTHILKVSRLNLADLL